jgi:hypothetical protein
MPNQPVLHICPHAEQAATGNAPNEVWRFPDNSLGCEIFRESETYRMRFPGLADFIAHRDTGQVECIPVQGLNQTTLQHLYLNQVMPAVLSLLHRPVFHASCVVMDGAAIAFIGNSGQGKSTLATHLALQGSPLLTDDGLELEWAAEGYLALPSHPAIRLWDDSRTRLLPPNAVALPAVQHSSKNRFASDGLFPFSEQPTLLRRGFFLGDGSAQSIEIKRLTPQNAHIAWLQYLPMLDTHDRARIASQFEQIRRLVEMGISYTLDYPRDYSRLPELASALRKHLAIAE